VTRETPAATPLTRSQRVLFRLMLALLAVVRRSPDKPLYRAAFGLGRGLALFMPARRELVRSNLQRVCAWLDANDMASPRIARAARDAGALDRLVRDAFGHWVLGYVEAALGPSYSGPELARRIVASDPETSRAALTLPGPGKPGPVHMSMHFGAVDLSALYGARVAGLPLTGPMEEVASPLARAYFDHVRGELGVTIVPLGEAAEALIAAVSRGEAIGLVADRNIVGRGSLVQLFGGPVRLPVGPALLAVRSGTPLYLEAIERTKPGEWVGHTVALRAPGGADRRTAVQAILEQEVRAFERIIGHAPEQWTTLFFPIWEDEPER
jgi:lauroyl/myristoyl acyltransferase